MDGMASFSSVTRGAVDVDDADGGGGVLGVGLGGMTAVYLLCTFPWPLLLANSKARINDSISVATDCELQHIRPSIADSHGAVRFRAHASCMKSSMMSIGSLCVTLWYY